MAKVEPVLKGLAQAERLYQDRAQRAKELKAQGKKSIGYYCAYPPAELIAAAGMVPYRITGSPRQSVALADAYLETLEAARR